MNTPGLPSGGENSPASSKKEPQIQGPRPPPLKVSKQSHKIKKPPLPPPPAAPEASQHRKPGIIYSVSPKIIYVPESDFKDVVQRFTGFSAGEKPVAGAGDVSPAARLASIGKTSPSEKDRAIPSGLGEMKWMLEEGVEVGQSPSILSPAPGTLPSIPTEYFSPTADPQTMSVYGDLSSPSGLVSAAVVFPQPSPLRLGDMAKTESEATEYPKFSDSLRRRRRRRDLKSMLKSYPLRYATWPGYVEGLLPREIISKAENGESSSPFFNDGTLIPEAVLNLAADLAVLQLIQKLISISKFDYPCERYIRLSTRSDVEKRAVVEKIKASLTDQHHMLDSLVRTLSIDASTYPPEAEDLFRRHVCELLELPVTEEDDIDIVRIKCIEKEMSIKRYLVILVDRDNGDEKVLPWRVGFDRTKLRGVLVLITTESTIQARDKDDDDELTKSMDLEIRTKDQLFPWQVFCHHVGSSVVYSSSTILTAAVRIVEECHSHLLAIVLVAKWLLMNPRDAKHWDLALHKMQHTDPSYDTNLFHALSLNRVMINTFLNLIWIGLNKAQQLCLLSCSRIPEITRGKPDYELVNYWISSLFLDVVEADQILSQLVESSILLPTSLFHIRMPQEIYEIVQWLYTNNKLLIEISRQGLTEPPNADLWHDAFQIELPFNRLSELPQSLNCPELRGLMLQGNADLTQIPSSFFIHMPLLRVLDLSYTSVRELPSSFFNLKQLRELYLKGCECFMKLPPEIGNLTKLEKLDLEETQITHLPKEVQKLTNMQSLRLYFYEFRGRKNRQYSCATVIPSGVISKLTKLKNLSIGVNPDDERWYENVKSILPEVLELQFLKSLSIYVPQSELLKPIPASLFYNVDFRFIVGCHMQRILSTIPMDVEEKFKNSNCSLKFVKGGGVPPAEIKMLLRHSKALFLDRNFTIKNLAEFGKDNLVGLGVCILAECKEMRTIAGARDSNADIVLPGLLFLSVSHMKNLRTICEEPTPPRNLFGMLKYLSLQSCPKLTTLFSLYLVMNLSLLSELVVKDCPKLSTLISHESPNCNAGSFLPRLRKLSLVHLPELTSISSGLRIGPLMENASMEIAFYDCPKLRDLSKNELSCRKPILIRGETKWWEALECSASALNWTFSPINEEADVMTRLTGNNDGPEVKEDKEAWASTHE